MTSKDNKDLALKTLENMTKEQAERALKYPMYNLDGEYVKNHVGWPFTYAVGTTEEGMWKAMCGHCAESQKIDKATAEAMLRAGVHRDKTDQEEGFRYAYDSLVFCTQEEVRKAIQLAYDKGVSSE